ncbi:phenol hydroxylase subunit [Ottowia thiooxydans]|uniref:phenol hydroxylase subunit n=1 Tax=Ottowia thiooxydans TaxID=219182 RepID=UPI00041CEA1C|nr:phenol hydroxylase subunit [Ottowia thiooxydans]
MTESLPFNPNHRFIRLIKARADGMVELEFALGEPQLFVELVLPKAQFEQFCKDQQVTPTEWPLPENAAGTAEHEWDWSLREARDQHFRHAP